MHTLMVVGVLQGAPSGAVWGSVSYPRTLWYADQGIRTSKLPITRHWPYAWATGVALNLPILCKPKDNPVYQQFQREKTDVLINVLFWKLTEIEHVSQLNGYGQMNSKCYKIVPNKNFPKKSSYCERTLAWLVLSCYSSHALHCWFENKCSFGKR